MSLRGELAEETYHPRRLRVAGSGTCYEHVDKHRFTTYLHIYTLKRHLCIHEFVCRMFGQGFRTLHRQTIWSN